LLLVGLFVIPRWLLRRAARQVINIFREHNATNSKNARTIDELGLRPPGVLERMMRRRDYKPYALSVLMQAEIIQATEDGKLYLSEEKLAEFGLEKGVSPYR
jgi:predicted deacetylase